MTALGALAPMPRSVEKGEDLNTPDDYPTKGRSGPDEAQGACKYTGAALFVKAPDVLRVGLLG